MQLMEARKKLDEANAHKEALETRYHDDQETIARLNGQNEILEKRLATLVSCKLCSLRLTQILTKAQRRMTRSSAWSRRVPTASRRSPR